MRTPVPTRMKTLTCVTKGPRTLRSCARADTFLPSTAGPQDFCLVLAQQTANKRISIKSITFASVLTFVTLGGMVEEAKAYLYCELKGGSPKKEWGCKECSPNAICGVKEECQTKCAKAETPKQAEDCLTIYCSPPQARSKRR